MKRVIVGFCIFALSLLDAQMHRSDEETKKAIVKIYTVAKQPSYLTPWNVTLKKSTGSGAIITYKNREFILTNAHVVANQTFLEVQRYGERKRYIADVYAVSHQADLALLEVREKGFFEGVTPLTLGSLPYVEDRIVVYGYPMGGDTLSATIGVVSRIEHRTYAHSGEQFLAIQVDAAVNPGNSGGPALSDGKIIGVVMQVIRNSQNIGYLVPVTMIRHFLKDVEDGKVDGWADLGLVTQTMLNPALRAYYGLDDNTTGVLVDKVLYNSSMRGKLKEGDILVAVDGHNIENDGTAEFRENEFTNFYYFVDEHQMGERVHFRVYRKGEFIDVEGPLKYRADDLFLVRTIEYDKMPDYFIFGGYVFSPLTRNLIRATSHNRTVLNYLASQFQTRQKREPVVLLKVLASDLSRGYYNFALWPIEKINGKIFKDFAAFYKIVQETKDRYIVLEDKKGTKVIIDKEEALKKQEAILKRYNIEFDKSPSLR